MPQSDYFNGPLYQRLSDDLHLAGVAKRTHDGYLRAVRQLADHAQCSPDSITEEQLRQWLLHLKVDRQFAYGSLRVAFSGVKFFFTRTCRRDWKTLSETKLRNVRSLPEVLTVRQVHQIIDACKTLRMQTFFWTVYSLGLRIEEGLSLRVGDIDSQRMMVHVHRGKGAKDRYLPLPSSTLEMLRENWKSHRHPELLFPNNRQADDHASNTQTPMGLTTVQGAIKKITRQLNFGKKVSTHTLRHCYATHLLEAGLSLRAIQKLLGHSSLQTTTVYLHLTDDAISDTRKVIEATFVRKACNEDTLGRRR